MSCRWSLVLLVLALPRVAGASPPGPAEESALPADPGDASDAAGTVPPSAPRGDGGGAGARVSNLLNPAISFNALLRAGWRRADTRSVAPLLAPPGAPSGIGLEEAEVILTATVDPYLKADAIIAFEEARGEGEGGFAVDLEEVIATGLFLPRGLGLRAGKMYLPFGRHNLLHRHQFPFIDPALVNERVFGPEGLNEAGVELSWLAPLPWFTQVLVAAGDGRNEELLASDRPQDLAYLGHVKNLWDLGESATLEIGGSGLRGRRSDGRGPSSRVYGCNGTYKYRPARRGAVRALEIQAEWMRSERDSIGPEEPARLSGGYLHLRLQATRRWWLQGRYDRVEHDRAPEGRFSLLAAFLPSEFAALRLQYATLSPLVGGRDHQVLAQLNFTIGSHPAHAY